MPTSSEMGESNASANVAHSHNPNPYGQIAYSSGYAEMPTAGHDVRQSDYSAMPTSQRAPSQTSSSYGQLDVSPYGDFVSTRE